MLRSQCGCNRVAFLGLFGMLVASTVWSGTFPANTSREIKQVRAKIRAAQFLSKATFGPTLESIDELAGRILQVGYRRACSEWIDDQFAKPTSSHRQRILDIFATDGIDHRAEGRNVTRVRHQAWWDIALQAPDQLRQRVAWAMSQIWVTSDQGAGFNDRNADFSGFGSWLGPTNYYDDVLVDNAFGNYRDLLTDMTFSPVMGTYLSHLRNRKANVNAQRFPDENYAREVMQLFSIGLYQLEPDGRLQRTLDGDLIPTYDNEEIKTLARLFTGFKYDNNNNNIFGPRNLNAPMELWAPEHDNNRNYSDDPNAPQHKRLFGTTLPSIPQNPTQAQVFNEISAGLDVLFEHPNVPPFISRLLIQRLVTSNPSRAYIRRVARVFQDNGQGVRGDFKAVIKAILLDPEVVRGQRLLRRRNPLRLEVVRRGAEFTRLREPVLRVTSMIRAFEPTSDYPDGYMMLRNIDGDFGQSAYRSPSVFNFYLPDFQPPGALIGYKPSRRNPYGALFSPEFQILDAVTANRAVNRIKTWVRNREVRTTLYNNNGITLICTITLNLDDEHALIRNINNMPQLLRHFDLLLCNGSLSEDTKDLITLAMEQHAPSDSDWHTEVRLEETLLAVLLSADCAVEE